jgi:hypothetical protein
MPWQIDIPIQYIVLIVIMLLFLGVGFGILLSQRDVIIRVVSIIIGSIGFG